MRNRVITGVILSIMFFGLYFFGQQYFLMTIVLSALAWVATTELLSVTEQRGAFAGIRASRWCIYGITMLAPWVAEAIGTPWLKLLLSVVALLLFGFIVIYIWKQESEIEFTAYGFLISFLLFFTLFSVNYFYQLNPYTLLYFLLVTFGNDIFAYFGGYFFGKRKLIPHVSPNKTIEGSVSGLLGGVFAMVIGYFLFVSILGGESIPFIDVRDYPIGVTVLTVGLIVIAQLGDLFFSKIKRYFRVKDYGDILPGHGGIVDRVDAVIFVSIAFAVIYAIVHMS